MHNIDAIFAHRTHKLQNRRKYVLLHKAERCAHTHYCTVFVFYVCAFTLCFAFFSELLVVQLFIQISIPRERINQLNQKPVSTTVCVYAQTMYV